MLLTVIAPRASGKGADSAVCSSWYPRVNPHGSRFQFHVEPIAGVTPSIADSEDQNHPIPSTNRWVGKKIQWYSQEYAEEICC